MMSYLCGFHKGYSTHHCLMVMLEKWKKALFFYAFFFSGTKHPREDNPNLYYWAEITGLHTQTFNI